MPSELSVASTPRLAPAQRDAVLRLVSAAAAADGVAPLSEEGVLAVRGRSSRRPTHVLAYAAGQLTGYAQEDGASGELVVAPTARRRGVGSALLGALSPGTRVWAHGDRPEARAFAAARGLTPARELRLLGRRVDEPPPLPEAELPVGFAARAFRPGHDEEEWLRVNSAAFAGHPEQGRLTRVDLEARTAEPWFDPEGLILVVPRADPDRVAAFHWTKLHPAAAGRSPARTGEVYVLAVDPAYQGTGLARPLTLLGLHHLARRGARDVVLYVEGDNARALAVYEGLSFRTRSVDRMYIDRMYIDRMCTRGARPPAAHVDGSSRLGGTMST